LFQSCRVKASKAQRRFRLSCRPLKCRRQPRSILRTEGSTVMQ
jgi:hypothetical protein